MHITCHSCNRMWEVPKGHLLGAKLVYGLGFKEHAFVCPNCKTKNVLTEQEFETAEGGKAQIPVTGTTATTSQGKPQPGGGVMGRVPGTITPGPGPAVRQRGGVVRVRSLHVRKDHSTKSETMAGLRKGEKVTIMSTWTDGENTWAQLGPDQWAAIQYGGEALIELVND